MSESRGKLATHNKQNGNDKTAPIYGESSITGTNILANNLLARDGVNVFVRLLPTNEPSTVLAQSFIECGDSFRTYPEECDDGNVLSSDGCNSDCKVEIGFQCIGGSYNNSAVDICSAFSLCGDGVISGAEECDDGNNVNSDGYAFQWDLIVVRVIVSLS